MSDIPPPPPSPDPNNPLNLPPMPPPSPSNAASQVQGPAYGMMVGALFFVLYGLYLLGASLLGVGFDFMQQGGNWLSWLGTAGNVVWAILNLGLGGLIVYGAMEMLKLRNYNMAIAAAVVSLLPCTYCCCFINLAMGIWALVVLMKPEVKAAFNKGPTV